MNYYIASLKHTSKSHEHITFWGPNYCGYVLVVADGHIGSYSAEFVAEHSELNSGECCIAVPDEVVKGLLSKTPHYRRIDGLARPLYDTLGPVVDNTRANWSVLIAAARPVKKPRPEVSKGKRRSFAVD